MNRAMPSYELVLRSALSGGDQVRFVNADEAVIGDVWDIDGLPWVITEMQPPFERRRIERVICVPAPETQPGLASAGAHGNPGRPAR